MPFSFDQFESQVQKALDHIRSDVSTLRTGKASVQLLDPVVVEAYGGKMKVSEVATIQASDATLLVISPWDKNLLEAIVKGVSTADLNVNPIIDGEIIRIAIPPLTEETRRNMVKKLHQKIEAGKVMLRHLRSDTKKLIEDQEEGGGVSEDDVARDMEVLEKKLQVATETIDEIAAKKEKELLTV